MDLRSGPIVNGAIGAGFGIRGFGLPATAIFVLAAEAAYAGLVLTKPEWIGHPKYKPTDFALDIGAALLGWGIVAAARNGATHLTTSKSTARLSNR